MKETPSKYTKCFQRNDRRNNKNPYEYILSRRLRWQCENVRKNMHRSSNICDALCVDGWMCECANCLKARGKKWTANWICDKAARQASRHGHRFVALILCTEATFQEAIKIYTKYPIYSDQRERALPFHHLVLIILDSWQQQIPCQRTNKTNCRHIHEQTNKQK